MRVEQAIGSAIRIAGRPVASLTTRMKQLGVPGVAIAKIHDSQVEWTRYYGVRNAKTGEPVTEDTLFQVASITKTISAVTTLRMVQDGVLDLDRNVNDYLKSWKVPENEFTVEERVTLRRLLSHNAGMTVSGFWGYAAGEPIPTILQVLDGRPPANNAPIRVDKKPGSGFRYSGGGYTVLQLLLEDVTGRPLSELAAEKVLRPAGMTHSLIGHPRSGQVAMAHLPDGTVVQGYSFLPGGSACCELWTTATDLARLVVVLQKALRGESGAILSPAMIKMMMTPDNSPARAGLGIFLTNPGYFSHGGGNPGFSSKLIGASEGGEGLVVLTDSVSALPDEILNSVGHVYAWKGLPSFDFASVEALGQEVRRALKEKPVGKDLTGLLSEESLNDFGYALLASELKGDAIEVFRTVAECYPQSANASDSLAGALETAGDPAASLANYRQALERLDKFPEYNKGYASNRNATLEKIGRLQEKLKVRARN